MTVSGQFLVAADTLVRCHQARDRPPGVNLLRCGGKRASSSTTDLTNSARGGCHNPVTECVALTLRTGRFDGAQRGSEVMRYLDHVRLW